MTNYEMMRSMTLEQMALTMMCPNESGLAFIDCDRSDSVKCLDCCLAWLKQEASSCRICGCTSITPCEGGCSWAEEDLCSACDIALVEDCENRECAQAGKGDTP